MVALTEGWDVEIVKGDLSELEAFELEAELVEQHGGCATDGGRLTNLIPGGEDPVSIELGIEFDDGGWSAAYCDARTFKEFPRSQEEMLVARLKKEFDAIIARLMQLEEEAEDNNDEKLADSAMDVDGVIHNLWDVTSDFLRRRLSWKDFALNLEHTCEQLEFEIEDIVQYHPKVKTALKQAHKCASKLLIEIDSGNKKEAEETASRMTGKDWA